MHPDLHKRVVKIRRDATPEQNGALATGCALSSSRILTCAHILKGNGAIKVCFCEDKPDIWLDATPIWNGKARNDVKDVDVAVLAIDPASLGNLLSASTRPWLARQKPPENLEWTSRGIPKVAATTDSQGKRTSRLTNYGGTVYPPDQSSRLELDVRTRPSDPVDWAGASGSPILVGCRVIGVLVSVPPGWSGERLTGVWLGDLLGSSDFAKAIGFTDEQDYQLRLVREVTSVLEKEANRPLSDDLGHRLPMDTVAPWLVADYLCSMNAAKLLKLACGVLGDLVPEAEIEEQAGGWQTTPLALACVSIVDMILPANSNPAVIECIEDHDRNQPADIIDLPCGKPASAEIGLAKRDNRPAQFDTKALAKESEPRGRTSIPYDVREGWGGNRARFSKLICDIASAAGAPIASAKQTDPKVLAGLVRPVLDELATPEFGKPAIRWHLCFRQEADRAPLKEVKELLPSLDVVRIQGTPLGDEMVLEAHLRSYLELVLRLEQLLERRKR